MKENQKNEADKLAIKAYRYSIGNIFIAIYALVSAPAMFMIFSLGICAYVYSKANKAKSLGSTLETKIKTSKRISGGILIVILTIFMFNIFSIFGNNSSDWKENPSQYNNLGSGISWFQDYDLKGNPTLTEYFGLDESKKKKIETTVQKTGVYELNGKTRFSVITEYEENGETYTFYLPSFEYDPSSDWKEGSKLEVIVEDGDYSKYEIPIY
jgi:hypothetical protein